MVNIIITGINGLLGQKLLEQAASKFSILGIDIHPEPFNKQINFKYEKLDITDRRLLTESILNFYPHYLINTAAMTDVDGCEKKKEQCWKINVQAVKNIVYAARKIGTKIVHLSSDYIFDGKNGPYSENDSPSPLGYYGKSKLASENVLHASDLDYSIVRTMVLYGAAINVRPNYVTWLISALKENKNLKIVTDQVGNPTLADDLAATILKIIELEKWDTFHVAGSEIIDRYKFALKIAEVFGLEDNFISPIITSDLNQTALRPLRSGFNVIKATTELGVKLSNIEEGLNIFKRQYRKMKS
ncbi:NAD(P)-dependent oxidoreductase [candidate division KSB1 bacterium]|nr:NAD(P)-dependent oxidoreductase [candidate division KSB1 bacterium]